VLPTLPADDLDCSLPEMLSGGPNARPSIFFAKLFGYLLRSLARKNYRVKVS
jgi:hypothetical protein